MEITEEMKEKVRDAIADAIGGDTYDCTRVWSAWSYGTMAEDDFVPVIDQAERIAEIADAAIAALTSNAKVTGSPALSASPRGLPGYAGDNNEERNNK